MDYRGLCADPIGVLAPVYAAAGLELAALAPHRMWAWLPGHGDRHGVHHYVPADFGVDVTALRKRFAFYHRRYPFVAGG